MDPRAATHTHTDHSGGFSITVSTDSDLGNLEFNSGFRFWIQFASFLFGHICSCLNSLKMTEASHSNF